MCSTNRFWDIFHLFLKELSEIYYNLKYTLEMKKLRSEDI